jgi:L-iditol 2-dehydrogenase
MVENFPRTRTVVTWEGIGNLAVKKQPIPKLKEGEILVKVQSCSICGSDLRIYKNGNARVEKGAIIGHEISGIIVESHNNTNFELGDRVAIGADVPCDECNYCISGNPNCCEINYAIGHQFEGGFSEYMVLNKLTTHSGPIQKIPSHVEYSHATLAEPLACCINGYERCGKLDFESVVIFGCGPIGIMLGLLGKRYGAETVIIIDPNESRLALAKTIGACDFFLNSNDPKLISEVQKLTGGLGADRVFTACPVAETHEIGIALLSKRGTINLFGGLPSSEPKILFSSNEIHYKEASITGSHGSTPKQHAQALRMISDGSIDLSRLITHSFKLTDIEKAYDLAMSGQCLKVVIEP